MKEMRSLYRLAERRGIDVVSFPLPDTGSMSVQCDSDNCYIGMDNSRDFTEAEKRTHLAHELGHCVTGSFYNAYATVDHRRRHENRSDKWAIKKLIPKDELDEAIENGCTEVWELAEWFGVTEEYIKKAVCYYTHGNLATELYF